MACFLAKKGFRENDGSGIFPIFAMWMLFRIHNLFRNIKTGLKELQRPIGGTTMKPKRKMYGDEAYELDNLYNEDIDERYAVTGTSV